MPFSPEITGTMVPPNLVGVKASFTGVEDPEAHLTAFHTQMMSVSYTHLTLPTNREV